LSGSATLVDATLGSLLEQRAASPAGDRVFLRMRRAEYSFAQLNTEANRLARGLAALGVGAGDVVPAVLDNCPELVVAWFALAKLGAVHAPINPELRGDGLVQALNTAGASLLITAPRSGSALAAVADRVLVEPQLVLIQPEDAADGAGPPWHSRTYASLLDPDGSNLGISVASTQTSILLRTSGTTGTSKACVISHRCVLRWAELAAQHLGFVAEDVLYCPFPLFHIDATALTLLAALVAGGCAAIGQRFTATGFWDELRAFGGTVFNYIGTSLAAIWLQPERPDDAGNPARLGWGVGMPPFYAGFEQRFNVRLVECYGLTDAGVVLYEPPGERHRPGRCGRAVHPYDVRLFDEHDVEVADGATGEIVIRPLEPRVIMDGYFRMPEATLVAFANLWFHTGDLAVRDADGYFAFVGRKKDVIRRRGENIVAAEIEAVLQAHADVLEAAAVGVPSALGDEDVLVCVVLRPGADLREEELWRHCQGRMAAYMIPRYIEIHSALPRTPTAKVAKAELREAGVTEPTWDSVGATVPRR
jgi:crotonobetaine/carnitine-CoA ligase